MDGSELLYDGFDPAAERLREALSTTGNGVFATRGAAPEAEADGQHYPGTYVGGVFNRLASEVAGRTIVNEDMVNQPNWLYLPFRLEDGPWIDLRAVDVLDYEQRLDLRDAVLHRRVRFRDDRGRITRLAQRRLVNMGAPRLAALESTFSAENWTGGLQVRSGLDGRVRNGNVPRYAALASQHLELLDATELDGGILRLVVRTRQSKVRVALAARTTVGGVDEVAYRVHRDGALIAHDLSFELGSSPVTVDKTAALATSRDPAISTAAEAAVDSLRRGPGFAGQLPGHRLAWSQLWDRFDLELGDGGERTPMILRLHLYHVLTTVSENTTARDVGVPARGLHGEAYRGHIFWDELFILPLLTYRIPVLARSLIQYRHRRLPAAREAARRAGHEGAMFPWQSGSDGREESQLVHLNPKSGRWIPDRSHRQRHINVAIAYNVWQYYQATRDLPFLRFHGGELLIEITRFLVSIAEPSPGPDPDGGGIRYEIRGVMGPDEFHDGYPDADEGGLDNNTYTNVMASWVLRRALETFEVLPDHHAEELREQLAVTDDELAHWDDVSRRLKVVFHDDGIPSQFEGYADLEEFDWGGYRERYGDIQRLDRILEAEDDTVNRYKASKQADVLMLFFLLSAEEIEDLFDRLGYDFTRADIPRTIDYYLARTSHGSTLSRVTHSWVLARQDRKRSWRFFQEALMADVQDVQGGTTEEGVHLGAMAGTVDLVQRAYTGLELRADALRLDPALPEELASLRFGLHYRGQRIHLDIDQQRVVVRSRPSPVDPVTIVVCGERCELAPGDRRVFTLR